MSKYMKKVFKSQTWDLLWKYSLIFFGLSSFLAYVFLRYHKGFIDTSDGITQHYVTLGFFHDFLLNFFKSGHINTFVWNISLGVDMYANLAYYSFGDFVSYLSVLFPKEYMHYAYYFFIFLRMYFVGLSFIVYAKYKKISNFYSIIGALTYTFSIFVLTGALLHPYFINALAIFPLLMYSIEKIVNENKRAIFIFSVFLTFVSSFYFGYMMSVCISIYGVILIIMNYKDAGLKAIFKKICQVFLCALIGIGMASVFLIPTIIQYFQSGRSTSDLHYIYNIDYYRKLVVEPISTMSSNWLRFGVHGFVIVLFPLILKHFKEYKTHLLFLLCLLLPLLIPSVGSVFCCLAFPIHRWCFVISFILIFLAIHLLDRFKRLTLKDLEWILFFIVVYAILWLLVDYSIDNFSLLNIILGFLLLFLLFKKDWLDKKFSKYGRFKFVFLIYFVFATCAMIYYIFDIVGTAGLSNKKGFNEPPIVYATNNYTTNNFDKAIQYVKQEDKGFYRISKYSTNLFNSSLYYNYNSINGYYSILSGKLDELGYDLSNSEMDTSRPLGEFNYRSRMLSLLSSKYFVSDNDLYVPYGYQAIKTFDHTVVYQNKNFVPYMAYYDTYIPYEQYEKLANIDKEQSLLQTVALRNQDINKQYLQKQNSIEKDYITLNYKSSIATEKEFEVKKSDKNSFSIEINKDNDSVQDLYLVFKNIQKKPYSKSELIQQNTATNNLFQKAKIKDNYKFYYPKYDFTITVTQGDYKLSKTFNDTTVVPYDSGNRDIILSLANVDLNKNIIIEFSDVGLYTWDDLRLYGQTYANLEKQTQKMQQTDFKLTNYENGFLEGTIHLDKKGLIQLASTYTKGLSVYIDGTKTDTLVSNKYFIGFYCDEGDHQITIKYETPYWKLGLLLTILSISVFSYIIYKEKEVLK